MKQSELAELTGKAQSNIARIEDPNYGKFTLQTLLEIADAFDVWLSVEFVSFAEGLRRTQKSGHASLNARSFSDSDSGWDAGLIHAYASSGSELKFALDPARNVYRYEDFINNQDTTQWETPKQIDRPFGQEIIGSYSRPLSAFARTATKSTWN